MGFSIRGIEELAYTLLFTHAFVAIAFTWLGWMLCHQRHERLNLEVDQSKDRESDPNAPPCLTQFSFYEKAEEPKKYHDDYPT